MADATANTSIYGPLIGENQPFDVGKMMSLASMAQEMRMRQGAMQKQNALSGLLANPQSYGPDGSMTPNAMRLVTAADPQIGIDMKNQQIQEQLRKAQEQHYQTEQGQRTFDYSSGIAGVSVDAYNEAKRTGADEASALAAATKARNDALDQSGGMLSDTQIQSIKSHPFDPIQAKAFASMNKEWVAGSRAEQAAELGAKKEDLATKKEDLAERKETAAEKQNQIRDDILLRTLTDKEKKDKDSGFPEGSANLMGALAEQGVSLPAGFRSKQQQAELYRGVIDRNPRKDGESEDEWANRVASGIKKGQIEFGAQKKETQTAAGIVGKTEVGENELIEFAPQALAISQKVPRGTFVPYNKLLQMGEKSISDPDLKELKSWTNTILNAYDVVAARGGTDKEKRADRENLITADSPETYERALKVMLKEAEGAKAAAVKATRVPELAQGDESKPKSGSKKLVYDPATGTFK